MPGTHNQNPQSVKFCLKVFCSMSVYNVYTVYTMLLKTVPSTLLWSPLKKKLVTPFIPVSGNCEIGFFPHSFTLFKMLCDQETHVRFVSAIAFWIHSHISGMISWFQEYLFKNL